MRTILPWLAGLAVLIVTSIILGLGGSGQKSLERAVQSITSRAGRRLAVTIEYTHNPSTVRIASLERTNGRSTVDMYTPTDSKQAGYMLELREADGNILQTIPFNISYTALADSGDDSPSGGILPPDSGSLYIVTDQPETRSVASLRLVSGTGDVFDERHINWSAASFIQGHLLPQSAQAQAADGTFTIVVVNELGAQQHLDWTEYTTKAIRTVEPWYTFRKSLEVVALENITTSFGCAAVPIGAGDDLYPRCSSDGPIVGFVERRVPNWDAIVVVIDFDHNRGSVRLANPFPSIVAVGSKNTSALIVHELGHGVGQMLDEYAYRFGGGSFDGEPEAINCYKSKDACVAATENLAGAKCSPGCWKVEQWRPANAIMHNIVQPFAFGPIERCIMGRAIAARIGQSYEEGCLSPLGEFPGHTR